MHPYELSAAIKAQAHRLGFSDCRLISIGEAPHAPFFESWLAAGRASGDVFARLVSKSLSPPERDERPKNRLNDLR